MKTPRMLVSSLLAVGVTFSLFYLMVTLVFSNIDRNIDSENLPGIHFGLVDIPEDAASKQRTKPKPPPPTTAQRTTSTTKNESRADEC